MKHLTVRNLPPELSAALEQEKRRRGESLNKTVIDLLAKSLGVERGAGQGNGLASLAGTWTEEEFQNFQEATKVFEVIDEELWR